MNKPYFVSRYVLQEHYADVAGYHWDLRIQIPNQKLMGSWALVKAKVPQKVGERYLSIRGNHHGLHWYSIDELEIQEGYGKGKITTLEKGTLDIEGWNDDKYITFVGHGDLINGRFALIKFQGKYKTDTKNNNWMFIKLKPKVIDKDTETTIVNKMVKLFIPTIKIPSNRIIQDLNEV